MCMKWMEIIGNSADENVVIDLYPWISRGMLDAIGQGKSPLIYDVNISIMFHQPHSVSISAPSKMIPTHW